MDRDPNYVGHVQGGQADNRRNAPRIKQDADARHVARYQERRFLANRRSAQCSGSQENPDDGQLDGSHQPEREVEDMEGSSGVV